MKKYLVLLTVIALMTSCKKTTTTPADPHVAGANCASCHAA